MQIKSKINVLLFVLPLTFAACGSPEEPVAEQENHSEDAEGHAAEEGTVRMSPQQMEAIGLQLGTLQSRNLSGNITVTGELEVPPQSEANVSATVGGTCRKLRSSKATRCGKGRRWLCSLTPSWCRCR
ncbi:hypothetical protein [Pontibacter rugosus]